MRDDNSSTAHYDAVIADLRAELRSVEQQAADLREMIGRLEAKARALASVCAGQSGAAVIAPPARVETISAARVGVPSELAGLGLGDACVAAIMSLGGRATNQQIVGYLTSRGYEIKSNNPVNNVGTGLNHRSKSAKSDVMREGNEWVIKKCESPAINEASHINGATVAAA